MKAILLPGSLRVIAHCVILLGTSLAATISAPAASTPAPLPDPAFPFGAVYFRKTNPPAQDWEHDHQVAADLGMNIFRHWFLWSAIEVAPDRYDWRDYDRMLELEAKHGIKVVLAEIVTDMPEWMWTQYPASRRVDADGKEAFPGVWVSSATGGAPLCLDDDEVLGRAGKFLTALVERYRNHPAVHGYDVWNEGGTPLCFCEATTRKFREWLQKKYGTLEALGQAWHHYSLASWDNVQAPRGTNGYAESLDWLQFRRDNGMRLLDWRIKLIRTLDQRNRITAHGVARLNENEWRIASQVDSYGFTWVASRHGNAPWLHFHAVDLTRAQSQGKTFWHAEATGGPLWLQPQVVNRPLEDGRSSDEKDVRLWSLVDMAGGADGILFTRWRPLLDGPLFGAFGPMGMDGSVTPRAEMAGQLAKWANAHPAIWRSQPVRGDVGLLFAPEALDFSAIQEAGGRATSGAQSNFDTAASGWYASAILGAYQGFFDSNIQADFVRIEDIDRYPLIYVAHPTLLRQSTADKLRDYIAKGGRVVSEGCLGYFGGEGTVGEVQPNLGLDRVFGAKESYVQFTPDLLEQLTLTVRSAKVSGRFYLQAFTPTSGRAAGNYADGQVAAVENDFGPGKTLLIGTSPGASYYKKHSPETKAFFAGLLTWAGVKQRVLSSEPEIKVRLHEGAGGTYVWFVNSSRAAKPVTATLETKANQVKVLWPQAGTATIQDGKISTTVGDRDAVLVQLN